MASGIKILGLGTHPALIEARRAAGPKSNDPDRRWGLNY